MARAGRRRDGVDRGTRVDRAIRADRPAVVAAMFAAALAVAGHVLGKSVRDTLYLASFPVEALPYFVLAVGLVSFVAVSAYTRLSASLTPRRVVPALAVGTALLSLPLYLGARAGSAAAIALLYVFTTVTGALLVSGFWAVLGERFDVRAVRRMVGLVGAATTVGGLVGGAGAHALLRVMEVEALMMPLAGVNLLLALALAKIGPSASTDARGEGARAPAHGKGVLTGLRDILASRYLRDVASLVAALTVAGTLADYALKDAAAKGLSGKRELAEFFSLFYGAVAAITLGVQVLVCRPLVAKKGLGAALIALPGWLALGAAALLVAPALWTATALRAGEGALRNSFHRAGYELLFLPLQPQEKRVAKPIVDTLLDRIADGLGALVVLVVVTALGMPAARLGWGVAALGGLSLALVLRVHRGYVRTLRANLLSHDAQPEPAEIEEMARAADEDATARKALRETMLDARTADLRASMLKSRPGLSLMRSLQMEAPGELTPARPRALGLEDPVLGLIRQLTDPDPAIVLAAIPRWDGRDKRVVPFLVRLLGRDDLHREATAALARAGDRIAGALADHLTDVDEDFAVRRRIPRALSACRGGIALDGLARGLSDRRFDVRYRAAEALDRIRAAGGSSAPEGLIWAAIREEVRKSRSMWEAQRVLEEPDEGAVDPVRTTSPSLASAVEKRGAHSLRHVFRLLGLVLDPKPLELCYRALGSGDPQFRAVSLEYLENVLPPDVRRALWPLIGDDVELPPLSKTGRSLEEVMKELNASGTNLALTIDAGAVRRDPPPRAAGDTLPSEKTVAEQPVVDAPGDVDRQSGST